jgi:hypothetical protein
MSALAPQAAELAAAVEERELLRLLGLPRGRQLEGDLRARADAARAWYAAHGRPFAAARRIELTSLSVSGVRLVDGTELSSPALAEGLRATRGHAVVCLAVSAGREVAAEASRLWSADRPDAAFFLDRFATAVTEALVLWAAGALCREAEPSGETLLPPRSPGCGDFAFEDQQRLARGLGAVPSGGGAAPEQGQAGGREPSEGRLRLGPLELLATGALDPPHSLLAALGVTRETLPAATPEELCRTCALARCAFRRAPSSGFRRARTGDQERDR